MLTEDLEEGVVVLEVMSEGQELVRGPSCLLSLLSHHQVQHSLQMIEHVPYDKRQICKGLHL